MTVKVSTAQRRARLVERHRLAVPVTTVTEAAEAMVALHATDPVTVYLSAWARSRCTAEQVDAAIYTERTLVRMLGMRRTMFVLPAGLAGLVQSACTDDVARRLRRQLEKDLANGGVGDGDAGGWLRSVEAGVLRALAARGGRASGAALAADEPALRTQLSYSLDKSYGGVANITSRVLVLMAAEGRTIRGHRRGGWSSGQFEWSRPETWLGHADDLPRDGSDRPGRVSDHASRTPGPRSGGLPAAGPDAARPDAARPDAARPDAARPDAARPDAARPDAARPDAARPDAAGTDATGADGAGLPGREIDASAARAELARRWLRVFGPAPVSDLQWWAGWTGAQTKAALGALPVAEADLDGQAGVVLADDLDFPAEAPPAVSLLPALDPTPMGWQSRSWFLGPHAGPLFDRTGNIGPTVWWAGRVVGGWAQRPSGEVVCRLLEDIGADGATAVAAEASRLEEWLGAARVTPRFRTPLDRDLSA
jgi:Winged helix DNA-binding domain